MSNNPNDEHKSKPKRKFKIFFICISVFLLISLLQGILGEQNSQNSDQALYGSYPELQRRFVDIHENYHKKIQEDVNDIKKSMIKAEKEKAINTFVETHKIEDWVGVIEKIGSGEIIVSTVPKTAFVFLPQVGYESDAKAMKNLYPQLADLSEGQAVIFSGIFDNKGSKSVLQTILKTDASFSSEYSAYKDVYFFRFDTIQNHSTSKEK